MNPERPWRVVVSCLLSGVACAIGGMLWWLPIPELWQLATETFTRPIRPMGLSVALVIGAVGAPFIVYPLSILALKLSERPTAQVVATLAMLSGVLSMLNLPLFIGIIFVRGIQLAS